MRSVSKIDTRQKTDVFLKLTVRTRSTETSESPVVGALRWVWFLTRANREVSTTGLFCLGDIR